MSPKQSKAWERQEGETEKAFRAFVAYRDSEKRSQRDAAKAAGHNGTSVVCRWAKQWAWVDRVLAYDEHLARVGLASAEDQARKAARLRLEVTTLQLEVAKAYMAQLFEDPAAIAKQELADVVRLCDSGVKLSQLVCGQATERSEVAASVVASAIDPDDVLNDLLAIPGMRKHLDSK